MKSYVVDAFTDQLFKGNPAAVMFLERFPEDQLMQQIALENRLSETAFAVQTGVDRYDLRWFTPGGEIDLCGHATLATGYLVFQFRQPESDTVTFATQSGALTVTKQGDRYQLAFPSYELKSVPVTAEMTAAFGVEPLAAYMGRDLLCVLPDAETVTHLTPDMDKLAQLDGLLQHVTAPGDAASPFDCVSRSFGPKLAVPEDPVCGSGHCHIVPYWAKRLQQDDLVALQASERTGVLYCHYAGAQTQLSGEAVLYSEADVKLAF